jgi:uncharacterized protein HemX
MQVKESANAKKSSPSKPVNVKKSSPSKPVNAKKSSPSKPVNAKKSSPSKPVNVKKSSPSKPVNVKKSSLSNAKKMALAAAALASLGGAAYGGYRYNKYRKTNTSNSVSNPTILNKIIESIKSRYNSVVTFITSKFRKGEITKSQAESGLAAAAKQADAELKTAISTPLPSSPM